MSGRVGSMCRSHGANGFLFLHFPWKLMTTKRSGVSLIELLVSFSIIGLLSALGVMVVQSVRSQARSTACKSNLAQIGIAMLGFEAANQKFPSEIWQIELLPYMEMKNELEQLRLGKMPKDGFRQFLCSADDAPQLDNYVMGNYLACAGKWSKPDGSFDGIINPEGYDRLTRRGSDIRGGTSTTAFCAEALKGVSTISDVDSRLRTVWHTSTVFDSDDLEGLSNECLGIPRFPAKNGWNGSPDRKGLLFKKVDGAPNIPPVTSLGGNLYNHALQPQNPSCDNQNRIWQGIATATSYHSGIVNVVFVDGHVESISHEIDLKIWQSHGDIFASN
jgi:prepilin-type processing-associated H-X9-DG protein